MSDYTSPVVSDESINKLCLEISESARNTTEDIFNINSMLADVIYKYYTVNHEPQIELPFEAEYEYIKNKVNKSLASSKKLDNFTHIFISGYLPNGKTIHYNGLGQDESGNTISKYAGLYINGTQTYTDYTCRAEEGGWERINVLIVGAPKMSPYAARLDVDYTDIPLKGFKMIVFDDLEEPVSPDIDSFLAQDIDTLKYIGDLKWTYSGLCTLSRLEVTKDIFVVDTIDCPCIRELIIPNVTKVPNTNLGAKGNIVLCDISNVKGEINYLSNATLGDLTLKCSSIVASALTSARLEKVDVGNNCQFIGYGAFNGSTIKKLIGGKSLITIAMSAFADCKQLTDVIFNNLNPLKIENNVSFSNCSNLKNITFSYLSGMTGSSFNGCTSLTNLTFIDKSISCNLYFNASPVITEESCLNIINAIADNAKITVQLHSIVKNHMASDWYCKEENSKYVSCTAEDEDAITQSEALILKGGTLA